MESRLEYTQSIEQFWKTAEVYQTYRESAAKRGLAFEIGPAIADGLFRSACHYCDYQPRDAFNGIDRVNNRLGYISGNCVACCKWCNRAKGRNDVHEFMAWVRWMKGIVEPEVKPDGWAWDATPRRPTIPTVRPLRFHDHLALVVNPSQTSTSDKV